MTEVHVKLFGTLRPLLPPDSERGVWSAKMPAGTRVVEVLTLLNIPRDQFDSLVILVNGRRASADQVLQQNDTLSAFVAVAGG